MYAYDVTQVATRAPDGTNFTPLGTLGHVTPAVYSDTLPGGNDSLTCTLQIPPSYRHPAFDPGRILEAYRGGSKIWEGILGEPQPGDGGWALTAKGAGNYGDNYLSVWTVWNQNNPIDAAITRGLRWNKPSFASTGLYLAEQQDSGSQTISDFLTLVTRPGAYTWHVGRRNTLSVFPIPTTPTRILMAGSPAARSLAGYINALTGRYQSADDNATTGAAATFALTTATNAASIAKHLRTEAFWDITQAGTISSGTAAGFVAQALTLYQGASWAGPLTVRYGSYTTMTGVPVDLGCEVAGEVVQLQLADGPYGGEVSPSPPVTFPVGRVEYDDGAQTLSVTPFQSVPNDLPSLLSALATTLPTPAPPPTTQPMISA
jgi:hypothetical protein